MCGGDGHTYHYHLHVAPNQPGHQLLLAAGSAGGAGGRYGPNDDACFHRWDGHHPAVPDGPGNRYEQPGAADIRLLWRRLFNLDNVASAGPAHGRHVRRDKLDKPHCPGGVGSACRPNGRRRDTGGPRRRHHPAGHNGAAALPGHRHGRHLYCKHNHHPARRAADFSAREEAGGNPAANRNEEILNLICKNTQVPMSLNFQQVRAGTCKIM